MANLRLLLFGAPHFELDGQIVEGVRRKAIALAAYLSLTDRPQTRDLLAAMFWPDQDDEKARTSLRSNLHNLSSLAELEWLDADRQMVSIQENTLEVDVQLFLQAIARTRVHVHSDGLLCETCESALKEAVALYEGDFLAGFNVPDSQEFDHWQLMQREWLNRECTMALRRLTEHAAQSAMNTAINYAHRWLAINALDEQGHRMLMRLYALSGQRSEALRQYQECVRLLDEHLATPPEDETNALYELIRSGEAPQALAQEARSAAPSLPNISVLPPAPTLVVGREQALADIKARLGIPNPEQRQAVTVIEGWPGVGKSTTIAALAHDEAIKTMYPDGVLWASLGEAPNLLAELIVWAAALHLLAPGKTFRIEELVNLLMSALRERRMLLIVDDVWQADHADPFRIGGAGCTLVLTSRLSDVARAIAPTPADVYRLPVLSDEYALALLKRLAPEATEAHPAEALELVHDLEGLPLAIQVAGRLLHEEMNMGWGISDLLAELRDGRNLLSAPAPSDVKAKGYTAPTVAALLKRSTDALDEETLLRFALLGLFVPKPATFDVKAMAAAWDVSDPKPTARRLVNRGLIEPVSGGRFQMHALLVMHAKSLLEGA